jgi:TRAP-type uncharacterized transport system substrate-binding protein
MTHSTLNKLATALAATLLLATWAPTASAQEETSECGLRIATGPTTGVYTQLARDLQKVCGKVAPLCQVRSKGGLENLMLLSSSDADIGFVQLDVLQQMSKDGDQNIQDLQAIAPMHANLLHIITKEAVSKVGATKLWSFSGETKVYTKFSDLKGAKIAVVGSAHLLGQALEKQLAYGMTFYNATDDEAIAMLQANQVQAVFTTGGWPYPAVAKLPANSGLMMADYDLPPQAPLAIAKRSYTNLKASNFRFLAAPNLLVTRPFKANGEKGKLVAALQSCITRHMDELQEGSYHAVWKEIRNVGDTLGVIRYGKSDLTKTAAR